MSDTSTKYRQRVSRKGEQLENGHYRIGVNGRPIEFDHDTGEVISGPTVMRGQYIPPSQVKELLETQHENGWYGHIDLAPTIDDIPLTEASREIMKLAAVKSEYLREGMLFNFNGLENWRIEEIDHDRSVAIISQESSAHRAVGLSRLVSEAEFLPDVTAKVEAEAAISTEKFLEGDNKQIFQPGDKVLVDVQMNDPQGASNQWVGATVVERIPDTEGEMWDEDDYVISWDGTVPDEMANHVATSDGNTTVPESWLHAAESSTTDTNDADDDLKLLEAMTDEELIAKAQQILEFVSNRKAAK